MNGTHDPIRDAVAQRAAEWLIRQRAGELSTPEKLELMRWLRDSPRNVQEYLQQVSTLQLLPRALQGLPIGEPSNEESRRPETVALLNPPRIHASTSDRRRGIALRNLFGVAAAIAVMAVLLWAGLFVLHERSAIHVAHGDQRTLRLEDGSLVLLNSQASASVRYTPTERYIVLDGQALFNVAKDPSRPFRVVAGQTEIVAVGTQFEVYRQPHATTVTVVEGKVDVVTRGGGSDGEAHAPASRPVQAIRIGAGEQVKIGPGVERPKTVRADLQVATAWVRREIVSHRRPLGEVADEFNRYLATPIVIESPQLRQTLITGTFSAYEPKTFLGFLREIKGVVVEEKPEAVLVTTSAPARNEM
jgi:transmembrane sensor